jgi:TolB-like protein
VLAAAVTAAWNLPSRWFAGARPAPRLSIVVLPFANLGGDPGQQYFADGITEDLTTDLSRLADMLVISRDTAFTYKEKPVNAKRIGHELGVRYVLEGSVQRSANQVRINAQLIDAESDTHLWAERFDRRMGDLFALQNEITGRVAIALNLSLIASEAARPTEHPDALDHIFRGRAAISKPASRQNFAEEIAEFKQALTLDPGSVEAQSRLASALASRVLDDMGAWPNPTLHGETRWSRKPWHRHPRARLRILPKLSCCARSTIAKRRSPNMRSCSPPIATRSPRSAILAGARSILD